MVRCDLESSSQVQWDQVRPKVRQDLGTGAGVVILSTCPENLSEPHTVQELGKVMCLVFLPQFGPPLWAWGTEAVLCDLSCLPESIWV